MPCIAVKNDLLINDPDFPEASDHFCTPLTIDESNQRLRNTFERGHKRARMKMANSTVEETIRKVGKIRAEEGECLGDDGDTELGMDMWTKAGDGSSSSAGFMDLNGTLDGSDCSSDSIVDVLKGWIATHTPDSLHSTNCRRVTGRRHDDGRAWLLAGTI